MTYNSKYFLHINLIIAILIDELHFLRMNLRYVTINLRII